MVAEGVEDAVGGDEGGGLPGHGEVAMGEDAGEVGDGELGVEAGDGLQLVESSAGVAEASAGDHRDGEAGGGYDGGDEETGLVAYATGGVLVHSVGRGVCGALEGFTGEAHGSGEGG